ncbi:hypothetical protein ACLK1Z_24280 [Escherichia coli]
MKGLNSKGTRLKLDHHFAVHSHLLEVHRPHSYSPVQSVPPFYPCTFVNASRVFYAIADMESGQEQKMGKLQKKSRDTSHKTTPPEGGVLYYYLSLSNQSPLSISFNPSTGR